jgi:DNA-binding NarL/FixJ family response regulator
VIRVVLVDDHTLVRSGIRGLLELSGEIRVAGEAADGEVAIRVIGEVNPDVVLLDVRLPKLTGLQVMRELERQGRLPPTILLTTFDDDRALFEGMKAGAKGFLLKDVSSERLIAAIRDVIAGETRFHPGLTERTVAGLKKISHDFACLDHPISLTRREVEVLRLMAGGYNNHEIAQGLGTSEGTVKNHVSSILSKLGVRDRIQAVFKGLELGVF